MGSATKGVSLRDKFAKLYGHGYTLTAMSRMHSIDRATVIRLLEAAGIQNVSERAVVFTPEPVEKPRAAPPRTSTVHPFTRRSPVICDVEAPAPRTWCEQCDRLVFETEAKACQSRFCKAQVAA